jgi:PPK2 family polyphosphate:nucleotide phosphotransferase
MTGNPLRLSPVPPGTRLELTDPEARLPKDQLPDKHELERELGELTERLDALQRRLHAEGAQALLIVLQGRDASGKDGTLRRVFGPLDPLGLTATSFKAPTEEELRRPFLWRVRRALPQPGYIGVFDRSHYEDVLIARVKEIVRPRTVQSRYRQINEFEAELAQDGVTIVKCMLHISADEQRDRLLRRLDKTDKHWKFNPADVDERGRWPAYREAYELALEHTNTEIAPWHVIPSDRKWYRNLTIGHLLLDTLRSMGLRWPKPDFDVAEQKQRLLGEDLVR